MAHHEDTGEAVDVDADRPGRDCEPDRPADTSAPTGAAQHGRRWPYLLARLVLAAASGGLLYLSYAPRELWWLAPIAFACLGVVLHRRRCWGGAGYGLVFGATFYLLHLIWIQDFLGRSFGPAPWLGLSAVLAVYIGIACGLMTFVARLPAAPVWMAAVFLLQEFARTWWPAGGFPWGRVAFSQPDGPFASLASLGGAPLVGLLVLVTGFGLAQLVVRAWHRQWRPWATWATPVISVLVPTLAGLAVWPTIGTAAESGTRTVGVVQGNAPNIGLDLLNARNILRANHLKQSRKLLAAVRSGDMPRPDLVVWPETATALHTPDPELRDLTRAFDAPMLIGARTELASGTPQNLVVQSEPGDGIVDRYAKQQLVPFSEYIPMRSIAGLFSPFVASTVDMQPGEGPGVFDVVGTKAGAAICYEVAYDYVPRAATNSGAELLVVPTNNAWFGRSEMSYQQLAMSRLRAIEHSRAVVVAATSGVSAIVRPDGSVVNSTELFTADTLVHDVPLRTTTTPADRLGGSVEYALIGIALAALAAAIYRQHRKRTGHD